ncbi:unnamed protein product, partial [Amoebophrya sp. A25]
VSKENFYFVEDFWAGDLAGELLPNALLQRFCPSSAALEAATRSPDLESSGADGNSPLKNATINPQGLMNPRAVFDGLLVGDMVVFKEAYTIERSSNTVVGKEIYALDPLSRKILLAEDDMDEHSTSVSVVAGPAFDSEAAVHYEDSIDQRDGGDTRAAASGSRARGSRRSHGKTGVQSSQDEPSCGSTSLRKTTLRFSKEDEFTAEEFRRLLMGGFNPVEHPASYARLNIQSSSTARLHDIAEGDEATESRYHKAAPAASAFVGRGYLSSVKDPGSAGSQAGSPLYYSEEDANQGEGRGVLSSFLAVQAARGNDGISPAAEGLDAFGFEARPNTSFGVAGEARRSSRTLASEKNAALGRTKYYHQGGSSSSQSLSASGAGGGAGTHRGRSQSRSRSPSRGSPLGGANLSGIAGGGLAFDKNEAESAMRRQVLQVYGLQAVATKEENEGLVCIRYGNIFQDLSYLKQEQRNNWPKLVDLFALLCRKLKKAHFAVVDVSRLIDLIFAGRDRDPLEVLRRCVRNLDDLLRECRHNSRQSGEVNWLERENPGLKFRGNEEERRRSAAECIWGGWQMFQCKLKMALLVKFH